VVEFRILGPLYADASNGTGPVEIAQPLLQSALAVLLLRANRPCPRDWLIEALWGSEPPEQPEAALRVCISRLRHSLGDCAVRLESVGPPGGRSPGHRQQRGYLMVVRPGEMDAEEFADLASQGEAELEMGNIAAAATSLMQGLELWGDPPLPDLPDTPAVAAAVASLKAQRVAAVDALIEARLAAGEFQQVLGQLRAAAMADPSRERTCAQLMRAYASLGMRREALYAYQRARQAMIEEQGVEPGPLLISLQGQILAAEIGLGAPPAQIASQPAGIGTMPAWQAPAPPPDFAGRALQVAELTRRLSGPGVPVTVITGGPGTGKTALAAAIAQELRARFPGGQIFADLGGAEAPRNAQDVLADVLYSLGVPTRNVPPPGAARAALYRSILGRNQVLVIADSASSAAQIRPLIPAAAGSAVLVTSRGRLGGLEGAKSLEIGELSEEESLALLETAMGPDRVRADTAAADVIVHACAGLPLALRIATAILNARPGLATSGLARELVDGRALEVLTAGDLSISDTLAGCYGSLTAPAQIALSRAATFIAAEIPGWVFMSQDGHDCSEALLAAGLITFSADEQLGPRYRINSLTRAYAAAQGIRIGIAREAFLRPIVTGFLQRSEWAASLMPAIPFSVTEQVEPEVASRIVPPWATSTSWLHSEKINLLTAIDHACSAGDHNSAAALATNMLTYHCITGSYSEGIALWRNITAKTADSSHVGFKARNAYQLALLLTESRVGLPEAMRILQSCAPRLEICCGQVAGASAQALLARCASACGRHALAIQAARRAADLPGDDRESTMARCTALAVLGLALARVGIMSRGADYCDRSMNCAKDLGEPAYEAAATMALAQVRVLSGDYAGARPLCLDGITTSHMYGSEVTAGRFLVLLGRALQRLNDTARAIDCLEEAIDIFRRVDTPVDELTAASMLALCKHAPGDMTSAAAHVREVIHVLGLDHSAAAAQAAAWAACQLAS
jgi:DNA-binding SARP family transcriptional activator